MKSNFLVTLGQVVLFAAIVVAFVYPVEIAAYSLLSVQQLDAFIGTGILALFASEIFLKEGRGPLK